MVIPICFAIFATTSGYLDPCSARYHLGDIALTDNDFNKSFARSKRAATSETNRLWPNGVIYYDFHSTFDEQFIKKFHLAMRHWELNTCIQFMPRKPGSVWSFSKYMLAPTKYLVTLRSIRFSSTFFRVDQNANFDRCTPLLNFKAICDLNIVNLNENIFGTNIGFLCLIGQ